MPSTQVDIIISMLLSFKLIFDKFVLINCVLFFNDLFFAFFNCSFDKSIPMYCCAIGSIEGKNFPVPHPASNTILFFCKDNRC